MGRQTLRGDCGQYQVEFKVKEGVLGEGERSGSGVLIQIGVHACRIGTMGHKEAGYNGQLFRYVKLPPS